MPVGLAMDGRWSKRYGWNSLDGYGLGHIFFPSMEDQKVADLDVAYALAFLCFIGRHHPIQESLKKFMRVQQIYGSGRHPEGHHYAYRKWAGRRYATA